MNADDLLRKFVAALPGVVQIDHEHQEDRDDREACVPALKERLRPETA